MIDMPRVTFGRTVTVGLFRGEGVFVNKKAFDKRLRELLPTVAGMAHNTLCPAVIDRYADIYQECVVALLLRPVEFRSPEDPLDTFTKILFGCLRTSFSRVIASSTREARKRPLSLDAWDDNGAEPEEVRRHAVSAWRMKELEGSGLVRRLYAELETAPAGMRDAVRAKAEGRALTSTQHTHFARFRARVLKNSVLEEQ
jgi:hypothetical protein